MDETTLQPGAKGNSAGPSHRVVLTLIAHLDPSRVGQRAVLPRSGATELARRSPRFGASPQDDPYSPPSPVGSSSPGAPCGSS